MMLYVPLDANFPDDPKIMEVGLDGAGLYAMSLCLAKRLLTDGVLRRVQLRRLGADDALIDRLVTAGLYADDAGDAVRICAWLSHNAASSEVLTSDKGSVLAHRRWHVKRGDFKPDCMHCIAEKEQVNAEGCDTHADAYADVDAHACPPAMPETEAKPEEEPLTQAQAATVVAKRACLVIAKRDIDQRIADGEAIREPKAVIHLRAERDLWPTIGVTLTERAIAHPDLTPEQLAEPDPGIDVKGLNERNDAEWRARAAEEPPLDEAAAIAPGGLAAARQAMAAAGGGV